MYLLNCSDILLLLLLHDESSSLWVQKPPTNRWFPQNNPPAIFRVVKCNHLKWSGLACMFFFVRGADENPAFFFLLIKREIQSILVLMSNKRSYLLFCILFIFHEITIASRFVCYVKKIVICKSFKNCYKLWQYFTSHFFND